MGQGHTHSGLIPLRLGEPAPLLHKESKRSFSRSLFVRHRKSKFMGVKLPDFVIYKRTIDVYFDLWLLQGAATSGKYESAHAAPHRSIDKVVKSGFIILAHAPYARLSKAVQRRLS